MIIVLYLFSIYCTTLLWCWNDFKFVDNGIAQKCPLSWVHLLVWYSFNCPLCRYFLANCLEYSLPWFFLWFSWLYLSQYLYIISAKCLIKVWFRYWHVCCLMQSSFVDPTSHLQFYFAELPGYYIVVQAESKLTGGSATPITGLLILFFLWNMVNWTFHICLNTWNKNLLFVIDYKIC